MRAKLCTIDEAPTEGQAKMFVVNERPVGLFNVGGRFCALDNQCPHAGASLAHGELENDVISCRIHHWRFCVRDGVYLDEDNARYNASVYAVEVVGPDIFVEL